MTSKISKILIANRGEIAIRIARAINELGLQSVGIYTHEDRVSLHRLKVNEAYQIGEGKGPVEAYLDIAFGMTDVSQRIDLARYTTGLLRDIILSAKESTIREAYIDRKYKLTSYSVVERQDRTPKEVEVTFQIAYKVLGQNSNPTEASKAPTVQTENTLQVLRVNQKWMIAEVLGKATSIDFPLEGVETITPGDGSTGPAEVPAEEVAPDTNEQ